MFWKIYSGVITVVAVSMLSYIKRTEGFMGGINAVLEAQAEKEKAENKPTDD